jgi:hypothetical protein
MASCQCHSRVVQQIAEGFREDSEQALIMILCCRLEALAVKGGEGCFTRGGCWNLELRILGRGCVAGSTLSIFWQSIMHGAFD